MLRFQDKYYAPMRELCKNEHFQHTINKGKHNLAAHILADQSSSGSPLNLKTKKN